MPEGPSIVLLKEAAQHFKGKIVISVEGNTKTIDLHRLENKKIIAFKSWGKHFLICFSGFTIRIHFLMFGSYAVNDAKDRPVRLGLKFKKGYINFYTCSVKMIVDDLDSIYDWSADVMSDAWNKRKANSKLVHMPDALVCDVLLNQEIFAGVGNIIKNEVLFRIGVHPESKVAKLPAGKLNKLIAEARNYSFDFLKWKRIYALRKNYRIYTKKICPRCNIPVTRKHTGRNKRRSFFCTRCQKLYV
jgi:endonuclease VIII